MAHTHHFALLWHKWKWRTFGPGLQFRFQFLHLLTAHCFLNKCFLAKKFISKNWLTPSNSFCILRAVLGDGSSSEVSCSVHWWGSVMPPSSSWSSSSCSVVMLLPSSSSCWPSVSLDTSWYVGAFFVCFGNVFEGRKYSTAGVRSENFGVIPFPFWP